MRWNSKKPWIKGLIIGLIPLIILIILILLVGLLAFFVNPEYGLIIAFSLGIIFSAFVFSIFFLIASILVGSYLEFKKRRVLIRNLLILLILLCLSFIGLLIWNHLQYEKMLDETHLLWEQEHQQKVETAKQLCGDQTNAYLTIFYLENGTIEKPTEFFASSEEKIEFMKKINASSVESGVNPLHRCLSLNNLPSDILD